MCALSPSVDSGGVKYLQLFRDGVHQFKSDSNGVASAHQRARLSHVTRYDSVSLERPAIESRCDRSALPVARCSWYRWPRAGLCVVPGPAPFPVLPPPVGVCCTSGLVLVLPRVFPRWWHLGTARPTSPRPAPLRSLANTRRAAPMSAFSPSARPAPARCTGSNHLSVLLRTPAPVLRCRELRAGVLRP